tara:strand:- start:1734 stop:2399 length:666 start_codon:yes stop_codon:yes gene_type:complete
MTKKNITVLIDFDDTITTTNIAHIVLSEFAEPNWPEIRQQFIQGEIPPEGYFETPFENISAEKSIQTKHIQQHAIVRPGFVEFNNFCMENRINIIIVSRGLDYYIEAVLDKYEITNIPIYAVPTKFNGEKMKIISKYTDINCNQWGICKCSVLEKYRKTSDVIIYIGDGQNDLCPARKSNIIFARDALLRHCKQENIAFYRFSDFTTIQTEVTKIIEENND